MDERVSVVRDLNWKFDNRGPYVLIGCGRWKTTFYVDPAPGYMHDIELVKTCLAKCDEIKPLPRPPPIYILDHDALGGTNAETHGDTDWDTKDEHGRNISTPWIVMFGKRIPLHPAMTRYLVFHEYGHAFEHFLAAKRYSKSDPVFENRKDYAKLRGLPDDEKYYGPLTWHTSSAEVFANDFRTLVCGVEKEFWPHQVPRPEDVPEVVAYWEEAMKIDLTPGPPPPEKS